MLLSHPTQPRASSKLTVVCRVQRAQVGHRHAAAQLVGKLEGFAALACRSHRRLAAEGLRQRGAAAGRLPLFAAPLAAAGAGGAAALACQPKVAGNLPENDRRVWRDMTTKVGFAEGAWSCGQSCCGQAQCRN